MDYKCLQLKEEASGIIDKLSPKYNGTSRILHQLLRPAATTVKRMHSAGSLGIGYEIHKTAVVI